MIHTLRSLISESTLEGEMYKSLPSYLIDATLSHPLNQRVVREYDIDNPSSEAPPDSQGHIRASRNYTELVDSLGERLGRPPTGVSNYLVGFPQVTFYGRYKNAVASKICERLLLSHGLDIISRKSDKIDATLPCGSIWLPVLSHPRGNETDINWIPYALSGIPFTFVNALTDLRAERKDTPLCKSLECYSVSLTARAQALSTKIILTTDGLPCMTGSTLKRINLEYLYL
jgi:hypothetical protein